MPKADPKNQFLAAAVVSGVATVSIGTVLGFSAILLPQLASEQDLSEAEKSWIASLSNIGQLGGSLITGILAGKIGRRYTIMSLCLPLLAGWACIGLSQGNTLIICIGRIFQGLGVMSSVSQVYLVEIADTERRGMFGASGAMAVSAGITLTYCLGAVLHWKLVCVACGAFPAAVILLMIPMPETPPWLVLHGRKEQAEKTLKWLRGANYDISSEIQALTAAQGGGGGDTGLIQTIRTFKQPGAYKPFLILMTVFLLMQLTGTYAVIFYAVSLFKDIGVSTNPYIPAIITGLIRLLGSLIGTVLLKHFGRKPLMIVSGLLMAFFMSTLAAAVHFKEQFYAEYCYSSSHGLQTINTTTNQTACDIDAIISGSGEGAEKLAWLKRVYDMYPASAVVLYMLSFGIGVGTVPWLLLGELCPSKVKGVTAGVSVFVAFLTIFGVVKTFPYMVEYIGSQGTYAFYAVCCLLMSVFTWAAVPETRGKSLAQIQTLFGQLDSG